MTVWPWRSDAPRFEWGGVPTQSHRRVGEVRVQQHDRGERFLMQSGNAGVGLTRPRVQPGTGLVVLAHTPHHLHENAS
jgi:hypothetical protein